MSKDTNVVAIEFTLKDGSVRVFTEADHGGRFQNVAGEFEDTNGDLIANKEVKMNAGPTEQDTNEAPGADPIPSDSDQKETDVPSGDTTPPSTDSEASSSPEGVAPIADSTL